MQGRFRLLALAAVGLVVATAAALVVSKLQLAPVSGQPIAIQQTTTNTEPPLPETTESEFPSSPPSATTLSGPSTTTSTGTSVTIAKRKTVSTAPSCSTLITGSEIAQLTSATASPEPSDQGGFCGFDLAAGGGPAGVAMIVLTPSTDAQGAEPTTFEGNTAYRTTTASTTCDLRIALTEDQHAPFRALWVTLVLTNATESTCPKVEKLAKIVFDKLPDG
ncbi:hypothetical protein [Actinocrispum sp. NPDC049592]|uniref:hypothetical protein n=1 Tax=Actinocrispum sp. NPDC049592 TaxID=3154835 RepID=UPI00343322CD